MEHLCDCQWTISIECVVLWALSQYAIHQLFHMLCKNSLNSWKWWSYMDLFESGSGSSDFTRRLLLCNSRCGRIWVWNVWTTLSLTKGHVLMGFGSGIILAWLHPYCYGHLCSFLLRDLHNPGNFWFESFTLEHHSSRVPFLSKFSMVLQSPENTWMLPESSWTVLCIGQMTEEFYMCIEMHTCSRYFQKSLNPAEIICMCLLIYTSKRTLCDLYLLGLGGWCVYVRKLGCIEYQADKVFAFGLLQIAFAHMTKSPFCHHIEFSTMQSCTNFEWLCAIVILMRLCCQALL